MIDKIDSSLLPPVTIVVIGHNESKNLQSCFHAINSMNYPREKIEVIYIDSQSTDKSIQIASEFADRIYAPKSKWPTAGEAFNCGIAAASHDFIHISAGDITLDPDYLKTAIATLLERDNIACVTGYFVEQRNSGWNKLIGYRRLDDVDTTDHLVSTPNGGTFRKSALISVNGYDERIKKGQETEIGYRFAQEGLKILYRHICQGTHDFDIANTAQMVNRFIKDGISSGFMTLLYCKEKNQNFKSFFKSASRNIFIYTSLILGAIIIGVFYMPFAALGVFLGYWFYQIIRVFWKNRRYPFKYILYRITMTSGAVFTYIGILLFFLKYMLCKSKGIELISPRVGLPENPELCRIK